MAAQTRFEMGVVFVPLDNPGDPASDYCDTEGVEIQMPFTDFEARDFGDHPYCFSKKENGSQSAAASYVDRSTLVYVSWQIRSESPVFDPDTELGALFYDANDAVLAEIYQRFSDAEPIK
jgi:hypothetical protein